VNQWLGCDRMTSLYNCLANAHDLRLVALAAVICVLAAYAAINLLHHARRARGYMKLVWLGVSSVSTGFGIWATHFVAMLAYTPGVGSGYNVGLTLLSLVAAILITATGLALCLIENWKLGPWVGGAVVSGGIASMHYIGMAAYIIPGHVHWDTTLVIASIVVGAVIGAVALPAGLETPSVRSKMIGAGLLSLAICGHHFTAMAAVTIVPDPTILIPQSSLPVDWLAAAVALASFIIMGLAFAGVVLDIRDKRRTASELDRMREFADASVEGLLVCDGAAIVSANRSFSRLVGIESTVLVGAKLETFFADQISLPTDPAESQSLETSLQHQDGSTSPVELVVKSIYYGGRPHQVIAVRDLRGKKKAEQRIQFLALHDSLTALPNRAHFNEQLDSEIAGLPAGGGIAVFFMDLDHFKQVNDLFGHAAGDSVLRTVASRVSDLLGSQHLMARLGGDEFAIMMRNATHVSDVKDLAASILDVLHRTSDEPEINVISTSIGVARFPQDAPDRQSLLSAADTALYRAKNEGRNTFRLFEASMGAAVRDRRMLEHDLRLAVFRDEFSLVYQPQHSIFGQELTGFEALLRWKHPERGDISPAVFIPLAEETGAITEIGDWVLRTACKEASSWPSTLSLAINVSAVQLYNPNFVHELREILVRSGFSPKQLEIEITETALVRDFNRALATLRAVKALGVRIAMDDFGTGYSSLSNLRAFPFDKIKIDRSFIKSVNSNAQAATIVRAVLGIGRGLGLPVLAEGVETTAELEFLRSENCDEVQGYLLGRPAPIEQFRSYMETGLRPASEEDVTEPKQLLA
jgi:diguanylate cyclase